MFNALAASAMLFAALATSAERDHILPGATAAGAAWSPSLLLREQLPPGGDRSRPVLYIHGATFPSVSSIMFRFYGRSWADSLNAEGFDVFGLDFAGYGGSERYPEMLDGSPRRGRALGRAPDVADQVERAVRFIIKETGARRVSIIAHSWGSMPTGLFAGRHPELVDRLVMFAPIVQRDGPRETEPDAWLEVTIAEQLARFVRDVPAGHAPVLLEEEFPRWAQTYLASDPTSGRRAPPSVRTPSGPSADVLTAHAGRLPYEPGMIRAPVLIVRGAWDRSTTAADACWLLGRLGGSPEAAIVTIPEATHLMHLETGREALYAAANAFLSRTQQTVQTPWAAADCS